MQKTKPFAKKLNNINNYINSLLEKNLNRLKFNNLKNVVTNNKIVLTFVAVFILFISYLLLPIFYKQSDISTELQYKLNERLNLDLNFSENFKYNFFPRPHFTTKNSILLDNKFKISNIDNLIIYVSSKNFFSFKNIKIKEVVIKNANFNLNKKNYNFFLKLLSNNFSDTDLKIKNSNIFFKNSNEEVLFINKILNIKYYYDKKVKDNILYAENEIFNIFYDLKLSNDISKKKLVSKLNLKLLKLEIENQLNYSQELKSGKINLVLNNLKSFVTYKTNKNFFKFNFFNKLENPDIQYEGTFNFNPFYSNMTGKVNSLNLSHLFNVNGIISKSLKTEIFSNKNIDFELYISADKISYHQDFKNIILNFRIQEGLIDANKTKFQWKDFVDFKILDSLFLVKNGELILDGKVLIDIKNLNEIYKFLLTPKNLRKDLKIVDLNFSYNFDQKLLSLRDIKMDDQYNENINVILNNLILKSNKLQNKIYIKNILNEAIKFYAG